MKKQEAKHGITI